MISISSLNYANSTRRPYLAIKSDVRTPKKNQKQTILLKNIGRSPLNLTMVSTLVKDANDEEYYFLTPGEEKGILIQIKDYQSIGVNTELEVEFNYRWVGFEKKYMMKVIFCVEENECWHDIKIRDLS